MSTSAGSQRAVNYLERRADFSALDALVSKRRGIDALRMNAETGWPSLAPIKVRGPQYSASYCVGGCNSAVASASTTSYSSGSGQASKFDPDWFRIGSPAPKRSGSASSKNKKKSHPKNKSSTVPSDKKKSQPKDKELSVKGDKQKSLSKKSLSKKSLAKDERMHMHADNKHIPTSKLGDTSSRTNDVILKDNEAAALRRRLERKVSREREVRFCCLQVLDMSRYVVSRRGVSERQDYVRWSAPYSFLRRRISILLCSNTQTTKSTSIIILIAPMRSLNSSLRFLNRDREVVVLMPLLIHLSPLNVDKPMHRMGCDPLRGLSQVEQITVLARGLCYDGWRKPCANNHLQNITSTEPCRQFY